MLFKINILLLFLFFLSSCKFTTTGILNLENNISLKRNTPLNRNKTVLLEAGSHRLNITVEKRKVILNMPDKEKIVFHHKKRNLNENTTSFTLRGRESKQNYDLEGDIIPNVWDGDEVDRIESCTYQVPYYVTVCRRRGRGNRRVCHRELRYRTIFGRRNVSFFIQHTDRNISVRFLDLDSTNQVGNFEGTYNTNRKVYTYEGRCR